MADRAFEKTYRNAPQDYVDRLRDFRAAHPTNHIDVVDEDVGSIGWDYIVGGSGDETILFLHGVGASGESHFMQLTELEDSFQVIAPTLPGAPTMRQLADGLAAIMAEEDVEAAHVFGVSFGGLVAQAFAMHYPDRVQDMILSHTTVPRESAAADFDQQRQQIKSIPQFMYGSMSRMTGLRALKSDVLDLTPEEQTFWKANFTELYPAVIPKAMLQARLEAGGDFMRHYEIPEGGPDDWDGRVLILESTRDTNIDKDDREALRETYPDAEVHTFTRYGHMGALVRVDENIGPVLSFLKEA